ncbi:MAG: hypothetical protein JXL20_12945 [Deltaproteobacteria bacterium]|nr:hypothetical protein [Deltaproteobacteria bacterium]
MTAKPTRASDYSPAQAALVRSVCLYAATKLGDLMDHVVVVGGIVPSLIIDQSSLSPETAAHVGTMDLDVGLALAIFDENRYEILTERLREAGMVPDRNENGREVFQRWRMSACEKIAIDALNSPLLSGLSFGNKYLHIEFIQIMKRLPVNPKWFVPMRCGAYLRGLSRIDVLLN